MRAQHALALPLQATERIEQAVRIGQRACAVMSLAKSRAIEAVIEVAQARLALDIEGIAARGGAGFAQGLVVFVIGPGARGAVFIEQVEQVRVAVIGADARPEIRAGILRDAVRRARACSRA